MTVNGEKCKSYAESCLKRGLIKDDDEWKRCMEEGVLFKFPRNLRDLFVTILIHCKPCRPEELWEMFKSDMSEDIKHTFKCSDEEAWNRAYYLIETKLNEQGKSIKNNFPTMPAITETNWKINEDDIIDVREEAKLAERKSATMNKEQLNVYNTVKDILEGKINKPKSMYVDGAGGTGKTFVYEAINNLAASMGKKVLNVSFTGIAASLLRNGRTMHNAFKLDMPLHFDSNSKIEMNSKEAKELRDTDVIICDEAPMGPKYALEIINKKLKEIMKNDELFGGKIMILGGDFKQVLPIKKGGTRSEVVDLSIKHSKLWKYFRIMKLEKNMRADPNELQFAQDLLEIGNGSANDENERYQLPEVCIIKGDLETEVFGDVIANKNYTEMGKRAILSAYNFDVDEINERMLKMMPGDESFYTSINSCDEGENASIDEMNMASSSGIPPHILKLKPNVIVMLLRNLDVKRGLCNGTRMQVISLKNNILECMIISGNRAGNTVYIPRITLIESQSFDYTLHRHQFPVKLAYSMTINKSQGQTFEEVGIDLRSEVFNHGQLYVAISRTRSWMRVKVKLSDELEDRKVKNIVFKEILEE